MSSRCHRRLAGKAARLTFRLSGKSDSFHRTWRRRQARQSDTGWTLLLVGAAEAALHDPVDDHGAEQDGEAAQQAGPLGGILQRLQDDLAETAAADQRDDHHHGQAHQDGLVHPRHDGRQRQRNFDVLQKLPAGRAEGGRRLLDVLRYAAHAERGQPDHRRHAEDDGGQNARRIAGSEKGDDRDQVDEGRQRLHQIQHRLGETVGAFRLAEPDPEGNARSPRR